jgi:hypothetical protein
MNIFCLILNQAHDCFDLGQLIHADTFEKSVLEKLWTELGQWLSIGDTDRALYNCRLLYLDGNKHLSSVGLFYLKRFQTIKETKLQKNIE